MKELKRSFIAVCLPVWAYYPWDQYGTSTRFSSENHLPKAFREKPESQIFAKCSVPLNPCTRSAFKGYLRLKAERFRRGQGVSKRLEASGFETAWADGVRRGGSKGFRKPLSVAHGRTRRRGHLLQKTTKWRWFSTA
jgi:hypothetical protein